MSFFDLVLTVVVSLYIIWQAFGAIRAAGKGVKIKGKVYGSEIGTIIVGLMMVAVVIARRAELLAIPLILALTAVMVGVSFFPGAGISTRGLLYNGRLIKYNKNLLYILDRETAKHAVFRFTARKEYVLTFPIERKEEVIAYLTKYKVTRDTIGEDKLTQLRNR